MRMPLFIVAIFALTCSAFARLGETLEQCEARYGSVIRIINDKEHGEFPSYLFQKGNVAIAVRFFNGRSAQEDFVPLTGRFSDDQIEEILTANSENARYTIDRRTGIAGAPSFESRVYSRSDGLAQAHYDKTIKDEILTVERLDFMAELNKPATGF
jgi:hypothetical protein